MKGYVNAQLHTIVLFGADVNVCAWNCPHLFSSYGSSRAYFSPINVSIFTNKILISDLPFRFALSSFCLEPSFLSNAHAISQFSPVLNLRYQSNPNYVRPILSSYCSVLSLLSQFFSIFRFLFLPSTSFRCHAELLLNAYRAQTLVVFFLST